MQRETLTLPSPKQPTRRHPPAPPPTAPEVVDPVWILKAVGAVFALGLLCSYISLCVFFSVEQWQFVLHPSRAVPHTPASQGLAFQAVRFGDDRSGQPQLSAWWMPGDVAASPTALLLHGETGSMSDALPLAKALHDARMNVLLFDYRGYGQSGGRHPTQALMQRDAQNALDYLTGTRQLPLGGVVAVGSGLGASLATHLCAENPKLPALVLVDADGDTATRVEADQRSRIVPVGLLFHERFPLADPLHTLATPKLLVSFAGGNPPEYAVRAASPKVTTELPGKTDATALVPVLRRFLDTYLGSSTPSAL
jgi:uncharacterized protein